MFRKILYCCFLIISFIIQTSILASAQTGPYKYIPKPDKIIGIWPDISRYSLDAFKNLKDRFGISAILVQPIDASGKLSKTQYNDAIKAGFNSGKIMVDTWGDNYIWAVDSLPAGFYYLGEPVEHNCSGEPSNEFVKNIHGPIYSPTELAARRDYVHFMRPDSRFVIDGYKRCSHMVIASGYSDLIMYSSYINWYQTWIPFYSCKPNAGWGDGSEDPFVNGSSLQTASWTDMRSKFGSKFSMSWVKSGKGDDNDLHEYNDLFAAANQLGLNGIWFYEYICQDSTSLEAFCNAAYQNGWLDRVDMSSISSPSNLNVSYIRPGEVKLSWQNNCIVESGYIIERKKNQSGDFSFLCKVSYQTSSFIDYTVDDTTSYIYRIKAYNDYAASGYSNEVSAVTLIKPAPKLVYPPDCLAGDYVTLNFQWNSVPSAQYYHYQFSADSLFQVLYYQDSLKTDTTMIIGAIAKNRIYYWRVAAEFSNGDKYWSKTRTFNTMDNPVYGIFGKVTYDGSAKVISGVEITLTKPDGSIAKDTTNSEGTYSFTSLNAGDYKLALNKTNGWGGVSAVDALLTALESLGLSNPPLSKAQKLAADVNNNGYINIMDADLIIHKFVDNSVKFDVPDWLFIADYSSFTINTQSFIDNITAIAAGDVNRSLAGGTINKAASSLIVNTTEEQVITPEAAFTLPVKVDEAVRLGAVSLIFTYPSDLIKFEGVSTAENMVYKDVNGTVTISWFNTKGIELKAKDIFVNLKFSATREIILGQSLQISVDKSSEFADVQGQAQTVSLNIPQVKVEVPNVFSLKQNFPNPFNPVTTISYDLPSDGKVMLNIYNSLGEQVASLVNEMQQAGSYKYDWNASQLSSGVYFYKITVEGQKSYSAANKMILMK